MASSLSPTSSPNDFIKDFQFNDVSNVHSHVDFDTNTNSNSNIDTKTNTETNSNSNSNSDSDSDSDPVIAELPVFLNQPDSAHQLYLLQYPMRHCSRPYDSDLELCGVRVKPLQRRLDLEYNLPFDGPNYDESSTRYAVKRLKLTGKSLPAKTNYCMAIIKNGKVYLTPLHAIVRMKPDMTYIDDYEAKEKQEGQQSMEAEYSKSEQEESMKRETSDEEEIKSELADAKVVHTRFKKRESEKSAAMRLTTHAYLKSQEEREEWVPLKVLNPESYEARRQGESLETENSTVIPFNVKSEDYLRFISTASNGRSSAGSLIFATGGQESTTVTARLLALLRSAKMLTFAQVTQSLQVQTPEELTEALELLQRFAYLVRGVWIARSSIVIGKADARTNDERRTNALLLQQNARFFLCREYLISRLLHRNSVNRTELVNLFRLPLEITRALFSELCLRHDDGTWRMRIDSDVKFELHFSDIVMKQRTIVENMGQRTLWMLQQSLLTSLPAAATLEKSIYVHVEELLSCHGVISRNYIENCLKKKLGDVWSTLDHEAIDNVLSFIAIALPRDGLYIRRFVKDATVASDRVRLIVAGICSTSELTTRAEIDAILQEQTGDEVPEQQLLLLLREFCNISSKDAYYQLKSGDYDLL